MENYKVSGRNGRKATSGKQVTVSGTTSEMARYGKASEAKEKEKGVWVV